MSEALISAIAIVDDPLILVTIISLAVEAEALKPVSILSAITCLAVDADELNSVWDVETDALKLDIGKVDEPLIFVTITSLAVEVDPLNVATEELIAWSVDVKDPLSVDIGAVDEPLILVTIMSLAVDVDPLNADMGAVDDPLILATNMFLASEADPLSTVVEAAYEAVSAYDEVISCLTSTDEEIAYEAVKAYDADVAV